VPLTLSIISHCKLQSVNQPIHPHFGTLNSSMVYQALRSMGSLRRFVQQQSLPATTTTTTTTTTTNQHMLLSQPEESALDSRLEHTILRIQTEYRPNAKSTIYDAKSNEYFRYWTSLYPHDPYAKVLSQYKVVYCFLFL
jgi:hypothetical protein